MEKDWNKIFNKAIDNFKKQTIPEITEPPCKFCKYFEPIYEISWEGNCLGMRVCHCEYMCFDFTCFRLDEM